MRQLAEGHLVCRIADSDVLPAQLRKIGLLPTIAEGNDALWVSASQYARLQDLASAEFEWDIGPELPDSLFAPSVVMPLGHDTCLTEGAVAGSSSSEALLMQLLPLWVESMHSQSDDKRPCPMWHEMDLNAHRCYSLDGSLVERARRSRERHHAFSSSRVGLFARSANYMGSKAVLAAQLLDVVDAVVSPDTTMFDLMCGSGAMAGAFARHYRTFASDAQSFSRLLGLVQGGGMSGGDGARIAEVVIRDARFHYDLLSDSHRTRIEQEDQLLNSELSPSVQQRFISAFMKRAASWESERMGSVEAVTQAFRSGNLISHLYANLFFGERQAAELDCLRQAIGRLAQAREREWALGALICAASACAYTYGGHFAQPKLDVADDGRLRGDLAEALKQRSLSVTHEFFVRFTSLAEESERTRFSVDLVAGPWEKAVRELSQQSCEGPVCVYVDPPYTRDEYSRYYHVLEAIVLYEPHAVSGKGRLPRRGSPGRFASSLNGRRAEVIEREIASVLHACLSHGWECVWSYSDTGVASIGGTLSHLVDVAKSMDIFKMAHAYKAQGKRGSKRVVEHAVHIRPS